MPRAPRRYRFSLDRVRAAQQFWLENCPSSPNEAVRSVNKAERLLILRPIHYRTVPVFELWEKYKKAVANPMGYHTFRRVRPYQVKPARNRTCLCPHCVSGKEASNELQQAEKIFVYSPEHRAELEKASKEFDEHVNIFQTQDRVYRHMQEQLPLDTALLVMDFTATRDKVSNAEQGNEWWDHNTIHWLGVVVSKRTVGVEPDSTKSDINEQLLLIDASSPCLHPCEYLKAPTGKQYLGGSQEPIFDKWGRQLPGIKTWSSAVSPTDPAKYYAAEGNKQHQQSTTYPLHHDYFDWFSTHEVSNDARFMFTALKKLVMSLKEGPDPPARIVVFSDGGPKHFKNRRGLFFMWLIAQESGIPIEWHFFASNHGKCRCDGHFGCCKTWHRRLVHRGVRFDVVADYVHAQNEYVPNTVAYAMHSDDIITPDQDVHNFKVRLRSMHRWFFTPNNKMVRCTTTSEDTTMVEEHLNIIYDVCPYTPYRGMGRDGASAYVSSASFIPCVRVHGGGCGWL